MPLDRGPCPYQLTSHSSDSLISVEPIVGQIPGGGVSKQRRRLRVRTASMDRSSWGRGINGFLILYIGDGGDVYRSRGLSHRSVHGNNHSRLPG